MKKGVIVLVLLFLIFLTAILTKPSDADCVELFKNKIKTSIDNSSANLLVKSLASYISGKTIDETRNFLAIEDNFAYKNVYIIPNIKIGTVAFGTFFIDDDFQNKLNEIGKFWERTNNSGESSNQTFKEKFNQSKPITKIKAMFHPKQNNYTGTDLQTLKNALAQANVNMEKIQKFHLFRTSTKRQEQIDDQAQYIQSLEEKIRELENSRN